MQQIQTSPPKTRDYGVDLIKTIAICDVLISHVCVPAFGMGAIGSAPWLWAMAWASISHVSVSLFLMASGALMLRPERPLSLKKLYGKNMARLLIALFFWAVCYKCFNFWLYGWTVDGPAVVRTVKELILFRHQNHLYYLHIMLLVYAFLPLTRLVAAHAEEKQMRYFLALWFVVGILYPTLRTLWPFTLLRGIPTQWMMNMTYASIGYTLLGRYLAQYHRAGRRWVYGLCALAGAGSGFFLSWADSAAKGELDIHFLEGMGVPMCLLAVGVYGLCQGLRLPHWLEGAVAYVSRASFCVFLTHIFFLKLLGRAGLTAQIGAPVWTVPLMTLLLLGCCCGVYEILRRIPVVRDYLV